MEVLHAFLRILEKVFANVGITPQLACQIVGIVGQPNVQIAIVTPGQEIDLHYRVLGMSDWQALGRKPTADEIRPVEGQRVSVGSVLTEKTTAQDGQVFLEQVAFSPAMSRLTITVSNEQEGEELADVCRKLNPTAHVRTQLAAQVPVAV